MTSRKLSPAIRLMVAAVGVFTAIVGATPASAASVSTATAAAEAGLASACPADSLCLFQHRDFGGQMLVIASGSSIPSLHVFPCFNCNSKHSAGDGNWGDNMTSTVNNTSMDFCGYLHVDYSAFSYRFNAGVSLAIHHGFLNDELSSLRPLSANGSC